MLNAPMKPADDRKKPFFVGLRMTKEERSILDKIQEKVGLTKTESLLKGLEILSEYYSLGLDQPPLSFELKKLEEEAIQHADALKRIRRREDALKEIIHELRIIDQIVNKYNDKNALIQILIDIQNKFNWISKTAVIWISERLEIPTSSIYQIATFYKFFTLTPRGRHLVRVCLGTACHVRGGPKVMETVERTLGVEQGDVTSDGKFSLERVNCLGCCALGPVIVVDNDYYGNFKTADVGKVLSKYS